MKTDSNVWVYPPFAGFAFPLLLEEDPGVRTNVCDCLFVASCRLLVVCKKAQIDQPNQQLTTDHEQLTN